ncbi:hypothetical protein E6D44_24425, partial [Escherichia coli]|nr:hypothetical protein [Escherichia coli]
QFVVAPVDAGVGHHQLLPARLDELGRRVGGHLAGVVAVHGVSLEIGNFCTLSTLFNQFGYVSD